MAYWYDTGPYVPEPLTEKQHGYLQLILQHQREPLLELLSDEERVALELMGAEEWLTVLTKWSASELIGSIERAANAAKTRDRSAKTARQAAKKDPSPAHRKPTATKTRRKWWATGR
jgi:hypothetical protein